MMDARDVLADIPSYMRTKARQKVTDPGVEELLELLGLTRLPEGLLPPVTYLQLTLPNDVQLRLWCRSVPASANLCELVRQAYRFHIITPSGAEFYGHRKGLVWKVLYYGPTTVGRASESGLFKIFCGALKAFRVDDYIPRIYPRTHAARSAMHRHGFVEIDENGEPVVVAES